MKIYVKFSLVLIGVLISGPSISQETLDASDISNFIIGGDQASTTSSLFLNSVAIIDVAPGGQPVISSGSAALLEAGLPILAGGTSDFIPDIWINYTYRPEFPGDVSEIFVRTSMPIPSGITLKAKIIETGVNGNFIDRGVNSNVNIDETNNRIVRSFGPGYTDDGETNGYKVQYTYTNSGSNELPPGFSIIYEIIKR
ncbi:hypothetical protein ATE92_0755 [Ulvibacter sp. MAR_2010_11]|uniref:hypothetical protein n=1 Tax=Ulvibacter sp. MAR_2010_11 TaxID=1250229 RepID=UPI000C2C5C46|nr:hypothetical protein [Ulvibacter sp. MAR_2010_11]PKA82621.1 hypothetical protein ATE92_0755 [Ulvibacter sp. MAR_2010_11]